MTFLIRAFYFYLIIQTASYGKSLSEKIEKEFDSLMVFNEKNYYNAKKIFALKEKWENLYTSCLSDFSSFSSPKNTKILALGQQIVPDLKMDMLRGSICIAQLFEKKGRKIIRKAAKNMRSIYIHKDKNYNLLPMQFYDDGTIYIHFRKLDPAKRRGGFKFFSRSINFTTVKLEANLVSHIQEDSKKDNALKEISIMELLKQIGYEHTLNFTHAGSYISYVQNRRYITKKISFQTELMDDDLNYLRNKKPDFSDILAISLRTAQGLYALQKIGYIHRDIKPGNFLLRKTPSFSKILLCDYGLSLVTTTFVKSPNGLTGTRGYIDPFIKPEIHFAHPSWSQYTAKTDIFSLGMSWYVLFWHSDELFEQNKNINFLTKSLANSTLKTELDSAKLTFELSRREFIKNIFTEYEAAKEEKEYYLLIASMLSSDFSKRPSLSDIIHKLTKLR